MGGSSPGASAGSWAALESQHRRGSSHISKIDNMGPSSRRPLKTSDTYKSSDWFRHDAGGQSTPRMPWPEVGSPRAARSLLAQSKSAAALGSAGADQQGLSPCAGNMGSCSPRNIDASPAGGSFGAGGMLRGRSESWLGAALPGSPRTAGSPQRRAGSPALDLFNGEARARSAEKRVKSPTFNSSEAWMRYSSPRNSGSQGCHLDEPPSPGAPSSMRRCKSADGLPGSDEAAPEAIAGLRASLSAAEPGRRRKQAGVGGTVKDGDHTKRRLQQDATQQFDNNQPRSQRRHDFPAQAIASEDAANATPSGSCSVPYPGCGIVRSGSPGGRRPMHQSSIETTTSLMPEITPPPQVPTKYIVGGNIVSWQTFGRRAAVSCVAPTVVVSVAPSTQPQLQSQQLQAQPQLRPQPQPQPQLRPQPQLQLRPQPQPQPQPQQQNRDHRNSDMVRESWSTGPSTVLQTSVPLVYAANPILSHAAVNQGMGTSALPSTISKESAFTHAGISAIRYIPRVAGACSPNAKRKPVSQLMSL